VLGSTNSLRVTTYGGSIIVSGGTITQNTTFLYNYSFDSTASAYIYLNGTQVGTTTGPYTFTGAGTINIGGYNGANEGFVGTIFELLLFNSILTTAQRQQVEGYLAAKWGLQTNLPATHPYYSSAINMGGLVFWVDAKDTTTYTSSASVTSWTNKGSMGGTCSKTNGTVSSTSSTINSVTAMSFSTGASMTIPSLTFATSSRTVFLVVNIGASGGYYIYINGAVSGTDIQCYSYTNGDLELNTPGANRIVTNTPSSYFSTSSIVAITSGIYIDGTSQTLNVNSGNSFNSGVTTTTLTLGSTGTTAFILGELMIFDGLLTTAQRQTVETYLSQKWGVALSYSGAVSVIPRPIYARPFQPVDIPGCQLWLDGADQSAMTFSSGTTVSVWKDKSGNGYNATILSGYTGATYSSTSNCLYFPVYTTGYGTSYSANPTNETMFVVFNNPAPSGNNNMVVGGPQGARSLAGGYSGTTGVGACSYLDNEVTWSGIATMPASTYTSGSTVIITGTVSNSSSSTISQNGGTTYSNSGTAFNSYVVNTYIGTDSYYTPPSYYYIGYIMEVIFFNSVLSTSQRQQVESYLAWKWGIRSSLPYTHPGYTLPSYSTMFTPKSLSGMVLWLDAADSSTITGTTSVTAWGDKSGNGNNMSLVTGAVSYTTAPSSVAFASGGILRTTNYISANTSTSVFIVLQITDIPGGIADVLEFADAAGGPGNFSMRYASLTSMYNTNTADLGYPGGCFVNGTLKSTTTFTVPSGYNVINTTNTTQTVSTRVALSTSFYGRFLVGNVQEVIIYTSAVSSSQRQQVEGYLAWKWGLQSSLPSTHAYAKSPP
jgi:hypothetical protein